MNNVRLTDQVGVVGIVATEFDDDNVDHVSTVSTDLLVQATEILETLGWKEVDIFAVDPDDDDGYPMVVIRPPTESLFGGEQAGIAITPRTKQGRKKAVQEVGE